MGTEMGLRAITWESYWLDDAWVRPGKAHAYVRGVCGVGERALCGYTPRHDCNPMYHDGAQCQRCKVQADKHDG